MSGIGEPERQATPPGSSSGRPMTFRGYILLCFRQLFLPRRALICSLYRDSQAAQVEGHARDVSYEEARQALYAPASAIPALADVEIDQLEKAGVFLARLLAAWGLLCSVIIPVATALAFCWVSHARTGSSSGWLLRLIAPAALGYGLGFAVGLLLLARLSWPVSGGARGLASWRYGVPIVDAPPQEGEPLRGPVPSLRPESESDDDPSAGG